MAFDAYKTSLLSLRWTPVRRPGAREASVAVVLAPSRAPAVLLIRRAVHPKDHWSGHIGLPGGRMEPCDAGPMETAIRETHEETGVALNSGSLLGRLDDVTPRSPRAPAVIVHPFVFGLAAKPSITPSAELTGHFWAPLSSLRRATARVPELTRPVPAYKLGDAVVWGLTFRILDQLRSHLRS